MSASHLVGGRTANISARIRHYGKLLQDFPNVRSIHAGGVLISEEPITCYTALDLPPKGLPTSQIGRVLGYSNGDEVIHRDDLVLLSDTA